MRTLAHRFVTPLVILLPTIGWPGPLVRAEGGDTAAALRQLDPNVLNEDESLRSMLEDDAGAQLAEANRRESAAWRAVRSREDWERMRDDRIAALKRSLGEFPRPPEDLHVQTTGAIPGDGYRVENLIFESRPGLLVTANLYVPGDPPPSMPGILICHSHHNPKTEGELQDMGMTWARQGCLVLVMDQLGHGERRQHPFRAPSDYPGDFRPGRQDYYFRYNTAMQLHLVGESLIGWMVWDLMRGVDLLLARPGIDRERIVLLGAVAGGGDPAAVAAAVDARIAAVVPFNFGGPQPETRYPLTDDAEDVFDYAGGGSWESTRNLRLSARDGFLPWVIVGSIAPRRLIYAHEFSWDRPRDPVWRRLQAIYDLYGATDHLAFAHGHGLLEGQSPDASHCNNIGPAHREMIHPTLKRWFDISVPDEDSPSRHRAEDLLCLTGADTADVPPTPVHRLAGRLAEERGDAFRRQLADATPGERRKRLRDAWSKLLGDIEPYTIRQVEARGTATHDALRVERFLLHAQRGIRLPVLLLFPSRPAGQRLPLVVAIAQDGKACFIERRSELLARLIDGGAAVCLPDLRGIGESRPGDDRDRRSAATAISASELMLGQTLVGSRLADLRALLAYLRERPEFDSRRFSLFGDSFAPVNPPDSIDKVRVPLDAEQPHLAEPQGPLLALFGGLFEEDVSAVAARGGLLNFRSALDSPFVHLPHDSIVPGALAVGDVSDIAAALSGRPLSISGLVDGLNRPVSAEDAAAAYASASESHASGHLVLHHDPLPDAQLAQWLLDP